MLRHVIHLVFVSMLLVLSSIAGLGPLGYEVDKIGFPRAPGFSIGRTGATSDGIGRPNEGCLAITYSATNTVYSTRAFAVRNFKK